jgi:uncharacterized protein YjbJ (UPF0337 family)
MGCFPQQVTASTRSVLQEGGPTLKTSGSVKERYRACHAGLASENEEINQKSKENSTMNSDQLKGKWKQLKGSVRERWGKLTDDDLNVINGQSEQLIGKIQERYGIAREAAQKQVDDWNSTVLREPEFEQKRRAS